MSTLLVCSNKFGNFLSLSRQVLFPDNPTLVRIAFANQSDCFSIASVDSIFCGGKSCFFSRNKVTRDGVACGAAAYIREKQHSPGITHRNYLETIQESGRVSQRHASRRRSCDGRAGVGPCAPFARRRDGARSLAITAVRRSTPFMPSCYPLRRAPSHFILCVVVSAAGEHHWHRLGCALCDTS